MRGFVLASLALVACLGAVSGYGSGAPPGSCGDMIPQHHTPPQESEFPFTLVSTADKKAVRAGEKVSLRITPKDKSVESFQGFMVQARVGKTPVGKFTAGKDVKVIDCGTGRSNAATHSSASVKSEVNLLWTAPPNLSEQVTFYVTVAENGGKFWVNKPTQTLTVTKK